MKAFYAMRLRMKLFGKHRSRILGQNTQKLEGQDKQPNMIKSGEMDLERSEEIDNCPATQKIDELLDENKVALRNMELHGKN